MNILKIYVVYEIIYSEEEDVADEIILRKAFKSRTKADIMIRGCNFKHNGDCLCYQEIELEELN
jgi:hypothetical protein